MAATFLPMLVPLEPEVNCIDVENVSDSPCMTAVLKVLSRVTSAVGPHHL